MTKAEEISRLFELKNQGALSEDEFLAEKKRILSDPAGTGSSLSDNRSIQAIPGKIDSASNFASCSLIQMKCSKCRGELQFLPGLEMVRCLYCGNQVEINSRQQSSVSLPNLIVPFLINREQAEQRFYDFLAEDDYTPDDIFDNKEDIKIIGFYSPGFAFRGKYEGNWSALSLVSYVTTNGHSVGSEEQATPISGTIKGQLSQIILASKNARTESGSNGFCLDSSEDFEGVKLKCKSYKPEYLQGFFVEALNSCNSQEDCEVYVRSYAEHLANSEAVRMVPTSDYRNLAVNVDVTAEATAILFPIWCCEINRPKKTYKMWLFGHDAKQEIHGERPVDDDRVTSVSKLKNNGGGMGPGMVTIGWISLILSLIISAANDGFTYWLFIFMPISIGMVIVGNKKRRLEKQGQSDTINTIFTYSKHRRRQKKPLVAKEEVFVKCDCQFCSGSIEYPSELAGTTVNCPHCSQPITLEPIKPPILYA